MTTPRALRLDPSDNVVIAIDEIAAGAAPEGGVVARERIPKGHKMAVAAVDAGAAVRKFGQIIGFASRPIAPGEWVHEHNCAVESLLATTTLARMRVPKPSRRLRTSRFSWGSGGRTARLEPATISP